MVSRKVILVTIIAVISLAAVGLGYAYTASTQNSGNNVNSEYVTLVQGGEGAYTFSNNINIFWDTEDKKVDTKFITEFSIPGLTPGAESDHMKDVYMMQLGKPITILTKGTGTDPSESLECLVQPASDWIFFTGGNHPTTFFLKVENSDIVTWFKLIDNTHAKKYGTSGWDGGSTFTIAYDSSEQKYYDTTVTVYYAIDGGDSIAVAHEIGVHPEGPSITVLNYAFLIFSVKNNLGN